MTNPTDTLFFLQRHLIAQSASDYDLNVIDVWDDYTGAGVLIGVVDDALDHTHADLIANYRTDLDRDLAGGDFDPTFDSTEEDHGTRVMGLIGAARNGVGVVGVAYDAQLAGFRLGRDDEGFIVSFLDGVTVAADNGMDIINLSLGASITFGSTIITKISNAVIGGRERDGVALGTIIVKSNGNDREARDDADRQEGNSESWDAYRGTISVAGLNYDGTVANYSTPGANTLVSAIGSGSPGSIITTDLTGIDGKSTGDYATTFNGTSAAAPQVSGVVALMLEANPDLGWRDVQEILAYSARTVGSGIGGTATGDEEATQSDSATWFVNGATTWNGGGLGFSNDYGFGLVDAKAAVRLAETWQEQSTSANEHAEVLSLKSATPVTITPDPLVLIGSESYTATETLSQKVEYVKLEVALTIPSSVSDLEIYLTSPAGTQVQMIADTGGAEALEKTWSFGANAFRGEDSAGNWTVDIIDDFAIGADNITLGSISLTTYGDGPNSEDDVFIFTNEFFQLAFFGGGARTDINGNSGTDTLNAAAVDTDTVIDLDDNAFSIAGVGGTARNIDWVYTGDGNDTVIGDNLSDFISTGRGNDSIDGGSADETIEGGTGNDVLNGGGGDDTIRGGGGFDTMDGGSGNNTLLVDEFNGIYEINLNTGVTNFVSPLETAVNFHNITTGNGDDEIIGTSGANIINTNGGNDGIVGGGGVDTINAGAGNDTVEANGGNLDGGANTDVLVFNDGTSTFNLDMITGVTNFADTAVNFEDLVVLGGGANVIGGTEDANLIDVGGGNDTVNGLGGADEIEGGIGHDFLDGGGGNDTIDGGPGNDTIRGGAARDDMDGGDDIDTLLVDEFNESYEIDLATGATNFPGETAVNFEHLTTGNGADIVIGSALDNHLILNGGADTVSADGGNDTVEGGAGNDVIEGDDGADLINGGADDDSLDGGASVDTINGGSGDDTIRGGGSSDVLDGGDDVDTLVVDEFNGRFVWNIATGQTNFVETAVNFENGTTGNGNDEITGSSDDNIIITNGGNDLIIDEHGILSNDHYDGGSDVDTVRYTTSYSSSFEFNLTENRLIFLLSGVTIDSFAGIENLEVGGGAGLIGDGQANNLTVLGNEGAFVEGRGGADVLTGGAGRDVLSYASSTSGVNVNLFTGNALGGDATGDIFSGFEDLVGSAAGDILTGDGSANSIDGGVGADTIHGGDGNDLLFGGNGEDSLSGGDDNDRIQSGGGNDTLDGDVGNDTINGGNDDDVVTDTDGNNVLRGQGGDDTLTAGDGLDALFGGVGDDMITGGGGNDTVLGQGNADTIHGGSGDDSLSGGAGNDLIEGGQNNDTLNGQGNNDILFGGQGNDSLAGAAGSDTLNGNSGNDTLTGGNGLDSLDGGAGDDRLNGGANADRLVFDLGNDNDTIAGFEDNIDTIEIATALAGGQTVAQLLADTSITSQVGGNVVMDFGGGDVLQINAVAVADLADDMLII